MSDVQSTEEDFWHVQLPSGDVRYWSLDELDEAFQRDEVDAKTYVLKQGETTWERLGDLLGLDDVPPPSSHVPTALPYAQTLPFAQTLPPPAPNSDYPGALSIRPVVNDVTDLDDDDLAAAMKPKRKNLAYIGGGAAVALVLAIVAISHAGSDEKPAAAAAPPPPVVAAPVTPVTPDPPVAPQATLSEDVKRSLLEADKAREAKAAARAAENAKYRTKSTSHRAPKSGQVFHKGGNKFDPLNSSL